MAAGVIVVVVVVGVGMVVCGSFVGSTPSFTSGWVGPSRRSVATAGLFFFVVVVIVAGA